MEYVRTVWIKKMNSEFYKIEPRDDLYIKLLFISKTELKINEEIKRGILPFHQMYYCLKGNGTFIVNDKKIEILPFDVLICLLYTSDAADE